MLCRTLTSKSNLDEIQGMKYQRRCDSTYVKGLTINLQTSVADIAAIILTWHSSDHMFVLDVREEAELSVHLFRGKRSRSGWRGWNCWLHCRWCHFTRLIGFLCWISVIFDVSDFFEVVYWLLFLLLSLGVEIILGIFWLYTHNLI